MRCHPLTLRRNFPLSLPIIRPPSIGAIRTYSTGSYHLPANYIIHTVGPVWNGGSKNEDQLLASCYRNSLELCVKHELHSVAFPCISTGIFGFPQQRAAEIAVTTCNELLADNPDFSLEITFCCFANADLDLYRELLDQ